MNVSKIRFKHQCVDMRWWIKDIRVIEPQTNWMFSSRSRSRSCVNNRFRQPRDERGDLPFGSLPIVGCGKFHGIHRYRLWRVGAHSCTLILQEMWRTCHLFIHTHVFPFVWFFVFLKGFIWANLWLPPFNSYSYPKSLTTACYSEGWEAQIYAIMICLRHWNKKHMMFMYYIHKHIMFMYYVHKHIMFMYHLYKHTRVLYEQHHFLFLV